MQAPGRSPLCLSVSCRSKFHRRNRNLFPVYFKIFPSILPRAETRAFLRRRGAGEDDAGIRREFQFPGDLWLPRRENRCRQPPNNHTSYGYHTPGVYTRARARARRLSSTSSHPLPLFLSPFFPRARVPSSARPPPLPTSSRDLLHLYLCLITNSQAYPPPPLPRHLRKIARDLNYCALLLSPRPSLALSLFLARGSNYHSLFPRPRFKLSREVRMIIYRPRTNRIFRSPFLSQF